MAFTPKGKGQIKGQTNVYENTELDTKLDYDIIVFNQIERTARAGSKENMFIFIDNVRMLESILWPYVDPMYIEKVGEIQGLSTDSKSQSVNSVGKINSKISNEIEYEANHDKLRALMNLAKRMNLTPSRKMKQYL